MSKGVVRAGLVGLLLVVAGVWVGRLGVAELVQTDVPERGRPVTARLQDGTPVWVIADSSGDRPIAVEGLSPIYQDLGVRELVSWCPASRLFTDGFHASRWDEDGNWASGPASQGLATYPAHIQGDKVVIAAGEREEPAPRDADAGPSHEAQQAGASDCEDRVSPVLPVEYADGVPTTLRAAPEEADDILLSGTLVAVPGRPLALCERLSWTGEVEDCPSAVVSTDVEHRIDGRAVWLEARFLADRNGDRLSDIRLLPDHARLLVPDVP